MHLMQHHQEMFPPHSVELSTFLKYIVQIQTHLILQFFFVTA